MFIGCRYCAVRVVNTVGFQFRVMIVGDYVCDMSIVFRVLGRIGFMYNFVLSLFVGEIIYQVLRRNNLLVFLIVAY